MKVYMLFYSSDLYENILGVYKNLEDARRVKKSSSRPWDIHIYPMEVL